LPKPSYRLFNALASFILFFAGLMFLFVSIIPFEETENHRMSKKDRIDLAIAYENEITRDIATGEVPRERLMHAFAYAEQLRAEMTTNKMSGPIPNMNWFERGPINVSGRTRAIAIDPSDQTKNTVWAAGVGGGLWKTTNISSSTPNWFPINDFFENIAITTIAFDPSNVNIIYFGTGEGFYNADAIRGNGIWKSTDGGASFSQLGSTTGANFYYNQKIVVSNAGDVYSATRSGLFKSTNGGSTWTKVLGSGAGSSTNSMADVEIAADNSIYAAAGLFSTDGVYRSTTGNAGSWTKLNTGTNGFPTNGHQRIELACAPSDAGRVYALAQATGSNGILNIYRTDNSGSTWTAVTLPVDADGGIGSDFTRGQAWYNLTAAVDPNNANVFWVGGIDLFKTNNGGSSWQQVSHWYGGFGYQNVHADQHTIVFEPGNSSVIYFGNDGGIYRTANGTASIPSVASRKYGFNVTQFYACAMHPDAGSNHFLAGAQDNGSQRFSNAGMNSTVEVTGGDGAFCHIDQDQPQYQFTSYVYNQYRRSTNGGSSFTTVNLSNNTGSFINPTDYDNTANIMYCANQGGNYRRWENPQTGNTSTIISIAAFSGGMVRHVSVSENTAHRVFFGLSNGKVVRVDNANAATPTATDISSGLPGGSVSCIAIETGNDNHLLVTYTNFGLNSVWETTNGGGSWTSVEGNLPDMPVRWALFNPANPQQAMLATDIGVWSTDLLNGNATNWGPSNSGLANVRTDMLQIRSSDKMVIAATHGRGLFSTDVFSAPFSDFMANKRLAYTGKTINFSDASNQATSWLWNFGDGNTSTAKNPTHTYANAGVYNISLTINGTLTATKSNYIHILPERGTPYLPADGGNFETNVNDFGAATISGTAFVRGNSGVAGKNGTNSGSNAWVTGITGNYVNNTETYLYTPNFNLSAIGSYILKFYKKNKVEISWDGFRVEYSTDKGDNWTILGSVSPTWYDFANTTQTTVFPINEPYFNSTSLSYVQRSQDISILSGQANVAFRIVFKSDQAVTDAGVAIDDFEISGPGNTPLPVELVSFTGVARDADNLLKWTTYSELNNQGFYVERTADGINFSPVGYKEGNGNSNSIINYEFNDISIENLSYYYRLKQIDFDGAYEYSNIILINRNKREKELISVYPNPFTDKINLNTSAEFLMVEIYNSAGAKVFQKEIYDNNYQVNSTNLNLSPGVYFLNATDGLKKEIVKLVKR
jgi:PKD repeat protein